MLSGSAVRKGVSGFMARMRLAVLGSTGSIGRQTLDIVREHPDKFEVIALAAHSNTELLASQAREFGARYIAAGDTLHVGSARQITLDEMAALPEVETVMVATVGSAGLSPTIHAIREGKRVALANKEVLIIAGNAVMRELEKRPDAELRPVDSEHSCLWQCLRGEEHNEIGRMILTASGGPFRTRSINELAGVTPEQALRHPTWQMGKKVTIDSATLMNKGFEVIETSWLFSLPVNKIEVVLHPQSIVHALVEYCDGTVKAVLSEPDMRLPIQYALSYPERWPNGAVKRLELHKRGMLSFEPMDPERFPCFKLALKAAKEGGTATAALSGADEAAVSAFLGGRIAFTDISEVVGSVLGRHRNVVSPSLADSENTSAWARAAADQTIESDINNGRI